MSKYTSNSSKECPLRTITSKGHPDNVPKDFLWMSPYGPLCNTKGFPLPTYWGRLLPTSVGRWNMTSWGRLNLTSWARPNTVLYVKVFGATPYCPICNAIGRLVLTSWGRQLQTLWRRPMLSNIYLQGTRPTDGLRTS